MDRQKRDGAGEGQKRKRLLFDNSRSKDARESAGKEKEEEKNVNVMKTQTAKLQSRCNNSRTEKKVKNVLILNCIQTSGTFYTDEGTYSRVSVDHYSKSPEISENTLRN